MKMKSYFAASVEAAMLEARRELGAEALLVTSRKAPQEARHLGDYEVVFAAQPPASDWERMRDEVAELRRQVEQTARMLERGGGGGASGGGAPVEFLLARDVAPELARQAAADAAGRGPCGASAEQAGVEALLRRVPVDATLGSAEARRKMVALVGPPGAGKTASLVKLAATYGLSGRRPAQIVTTDTNRIAAAGQLRTYAAILGVGFQMAETPAALGPILEEHRNKDLVLIDTPGYAPAEMDDALELSKAIANQREVEVHLVLSAVMKSADLFRAVERYQGFRPRKLLFTRLDETDTAGTALSLAVQTGLPISFLCGGQQIPEDLQPATIETLTRTLSGEGRATAAAA